MEVYWQLAVALGLGLLVGLQREWATAEVAGIRTFALITLLGAVAAMLSPWVIAAGMLGVLGIMLLGNFIRIRQDQADAGMTTEIAALVMFAAGAAVGAGLIGAGVVVGGATAVLLHWKQPLHQLTRRVGDKDLHAIIQFVLIALVILPVLPNRTYGPYQVLNPYKIWLMVVLIVGFSLGAYVTYKLLGPRVGSLLGGLLGGLISSTATTVSYARQTRDRPEAADLAVVVILIASAIAFVRIIAEIAVVAPASLAHLAPPLVAMLAFMAALTAVAFVVMSGRQGATVPEPTNPAQLKTAIVFGALYAIILLAVAATRNHLGHQALYAVAVVSGLTDMDAITLSTAQLVNGGRLEAGTGWRMILIASLANLVFKGLAVAVLGAPVLARKIALWFGLAIAGGIGLLILWP